MASILTPILLLTVSAIFDSGLLAMATRQPPRGERVDYTGYRLLQTDGGRSISGTLLERLQDLQVDVWSRNTMLVSPKSLPSVRRLLRNHGVDFSYLSEDVQSLIRQERPDYEPSPRRIKRQHRQANANASRAGDRCGTHEDTLDFLVRKGLAVSDENLTSVEALERAPLLFYLTYCQIQAWLREMAARNPDVLNLHEYGLSYENRSLVLAKIGLEQASRNRSKPIVWVDGGIHAREWISVSSSLYLVHLLVVSKRTGEPQIVELLERYDFYVAPLLNPDGYDYTFYNDRFWRKTRCLTVVPWCRGVDANRNFNFHWGECQFPSRTLPHCSSTYAGKRPFSEPEAHSFSRFFWSIRRLVKIYLSLHNFGNIWFLPYGYTLDKPADYDQMVLVSKMAVDRIQTEHDTTYQVARPGDIMYFACGGSFDWVKGRVGVKYSFTLEIGAIGFAIPPRHIVASGREVRTGLVALLEAVEATDPCWIDSAPAECRAGLPKDPPDGIEGSKGRRSSPKRA